MNTAGISAGPAYAADMSACEVNILLCAGLPRYSAGPFFASVSGNATAYVIICADVRAGAVTVV